MDKLINFLLIVNTAPKTVITHIVVLLNMIFPLVKSVSFRNERNISNTKKDPNTKLINLSIPLPYRSKIKIYCENLFLWVENYYGDIKIINNGILYHNIS